MTTKRKFLDNWNCLSKREISEAVGYLLEHYKKYKIKINDCGTKVQIGNHVNIFASHINREYVYTINNVCFSATKSGTGTQVEKLFYACKDEAYEQARIREQKYEKIKTSCISCVFGVILVAVAEYVVIDMKNREKEIDKQVKQYEQTLPEYLEQKQAVANYRDSLINAKTK